MYKVHLEREIAVSHTLRMHKGKCSNLHGHNLKVEVDIESSILHDSGSSSGMVADFGDIKSIIDELDHTNINSVFDDKASRAVCNDEKRFYTEISIQPTAEHLAEYFAKNIVKLLDRSGEYNVSVKVHEATNQWAQYVTGR